MGSIRGLFNSVSLKCCRNVTNYLFVNKCVLRGVFFGILTLGGVNQLVWSRHFLGHRGKRGKKTETYARAYC